MAKIEYIETCVSRISSANSNLPIADVEVRENLNKVNAEVEHISQTVTDITSKEIPKIKTDINDNFTNFKKYLKVPNEKAEVFPAETNQGKIWVENVSIQNNLVWVNDTNNISLKNTGHPVPAPNNIQMKGGDCTYIPTQTFGGQHKWTNYTQCTTVQKNPYDINCEVTYDGWRNQVQCSWQNVEQQTRPLQGSVNCGTVSIPMNCVTYWSNCNTKYINCNVHEERPIGTGYNNCQEYSNCYNYWNNCYQYYGNCLQAR